MDARHAELWRKIRDFEVDDLSSELTFTDRLARENDWPLEFARRVVDEYKRFIFLVAAAPHRVTPSEEVDEAWHLHLIYTRSYWDELCHNLVRRPLHHGPTKGGHAETLRFHDQYLRTLASYREVFGEEPPGDIWPRGKGTARRKRRFKRVDLTDVWIIPKPWATIKQLLREHSRIAFCVAPVAVAIVNPFELTGPHFVQFFPCLVLAAALVAFVVRYVLRPNNAATHGELSLYQIACLADGKPGLVRAAVVSLIDRKAIEVVASKVGGIGANDYRIKVRHGLPDSAEEIDKRIMAACNVANGCHLADALTAAEPAAERVD